MIKEKIPKLKKIKLSKNTKKIITTAVITFVVFMFLLCPLTIIIIHTFL